MAQSNPRSEIRAWFKQALESQTETLGQIYSKRVVILDPDESPTVFTNIYISDGELQTSDEGLGVLTYLSVDIGLHIKAGEDDDLDLMEQAVETALVEYDNTNPSTFSFYKQRFTYAGDSEDTYQQLYLTFQVITR